MKGIDLGSNPGGANFFKIIARRAILTILFHFRLQSPSWLEAREIKNLSFAERESRAGGKFYISSITGLSSINSEGNPIFLK